MNQILSIKSHESCKCDLLEMSNETQMLRIYTKYYIYTNTQHYKYTTE